MKYLLGLALLVSAAAHSAPVPKLVLTCSDENAIGQPQDACHGTWAYALPTDPLIVSSGSSYVWRVFGGLSGTDTVLVCTLPVEPGQYSSCRDAAGVRRTDLLPKYSIVGDDSVTVSKTGGDYTDPVTAADNALFGDRWCVRPQWPEQPCVMAIGEGVFILRHMLAIPPGVVVAGAGKGDTMLVLPDHGGGIAVSSFGNVRISDLTIINSQPGFGRPWGFFADTAPGGAPTLAELQGVAIHVSGAFESAGIFKRNALAMLDSEITAAGPDSTGIDTLFHIPASAQGGAGMTLERTRVAAEVALDQPEGTGEMRLIDSHVFGTVAFNGIGSLLEIAGSGIVGDVTAGNTGLRVAITGSSIKGNVDVSRALSASGVDQTHIADTRVDGSLEAGGTNNADFDGLTVHGGFELQGLRSVFNRYKVRHSYLYSTTSTPLRIATSAIDLEQSFVQGGEQRGAVFIRGSFHALSSVLAGRVGSESADLQCTDTYGADYELLTALCQRQSP